MAQQGNGNGGSQTHERKYVAQVSLILEAFGREVEVHPADWEKQPDGVDYLCRAGTVLVRDEDLTRVDFETDVLQHFERAEFFREVLNRHAYRARICGCTLLR